MNDNKFTPEEKIFTVLIIFQIIMMIIAIKFLTGAARPPKRMTDMQNKYMTLIRYDDKLYFFTPDELDLVCRCVMSEAGAEPDEGQIAVAEVIFNRYFSPKFPNEISEIIVPGQFSISDNGEPTARVIRNVRTAMMNYRHSRMILPYNCYYFRADCYHDFGIPYRQIGNHYFSLSEEATD